MNTNFMNAETGLHIFWGSNINKLFVYDNGEILAELESIQEHTIKDNKISEVYDGMPLEVYIKGEIKKALKLNLNRKDNFYMINSEKRYSFEPAYNLYLHVSAFANFEKNGEILHHDYDHEKCFLDSYKITFYKATFKRHKLEHIICEDYTLENEESFGSGYGWDKEHAQISYYEIDENTFSARKSPERIGEKGIIKKWFEKETLSNHELLATKRGYTTIVIDDYREKSRELAEKINKILPSKHISYYDIETLQKAGITINFN